MDKKITNEERSRIFAAYYPCDVISTGGKVTALIAVGDNPTICWKEEENTKWGHSRYEWQRLLLTPLSEIKDEHATVICDLLNFQYSNTNEDYFFDLAGLACWLKEMFDGENEFMDTFGFDRAVKAIDYLRSVDYNIGHGSHSPADLIDLGVVITHPIK